MQQAVKNDHPNSRVFLQDCMDLMAQYPDNHFDLAVVDPPYGIKASKDGRFGEYAGENSASRTKNYKAKDWDDSPPTEQYFNELFRVSRNQIVWGVNYFFDKRLLGGRIFWDKQVSEGFIKSKGEIAFKSFGCSVDYVKIMWHGMLQHNMKDKEIRIHPTQKPIALYDWLFEKYAKKGDKILDTHLGSGSSRIAAWRHGLDFTGCEIDPEYFQASIERFEIAIRQPSLFQ